MKLASELNGATPKCIIFPCPGNSFSTAELFAKTGTSNGLVTPLKYPLIFSVSDVLIINKLDYLHMEDFKTDRVIEKTRVLNESIQIFQLSCKTSYGLDGWFKWIENEISTVQGDHAS